MTEDQVELVSTPVDEIPEENLFDPAPLVARLTAGVESVKALADRQSEYMAEQAVDKPEPEARIQKISSSGRVKVQFTSELDIPEGTLEKIKQ